MLFQKHSYRCTGEPLLTSSLSLNHLTLYEEECTLSDFHSLLYSPLHTELELFDELVV